MSKLISYFLLLRMDRIQTAIWRIFASKSVILSNIKYLNMDIALFYTIDWTTAKYYPNGYFCGTCGESVNHTVYKYNGSRLCNGCAAVVKTIYI